jgi:hypothetical protein
MATMTLNASNYNICQNNNYDILNENGVAVGSDGRWNATTSDKSFKIRAKDNYSFNPLNDETPLVNFSGFRMFVSGIGTWYCTDYTLTYNDDYTEITVNLVSGDMYDNWGNWSAQFRVDNNVKATPKKVLQNFTITENLTGCTSNNTDTTITEGTTKTITYDSGTGKKFVAELCSCNTGSFDIIGKYFASWTVKNVDKDVVITMVANTPAVYYDVETNLTNVSADENNPIKVEENTDFTLIYHANNGYKINTITCNIGTVVISDDKLTATITGVATENISVVAMGKKIHYVYITGKLNNCVCNYENGEEITDDKIVTITANTGYTFKGVYTYKNLDTAITNQFSKNKEQTILTIDYVATWNSYDIDLNSYYGATKESELVSTFVNLYRVTNSEMKQLAVARFVDSKGTTVDYGEFITQLYVLPFEISRDIIGERDNIILGNYDSNVESTMLIDSKLYINGGLITAPNKYNNVYDYLNTTCTLRLPFFNPIILDVDNVIDKTISIQYIVDLYSGNCTVNISSSFTGEIIHSETTNIVTQIPFIQKQNNSIVNQLSNANENLIDNAFIEIVRNIPYYANDIFGKATIVFDTVGSVTGYCEISDVQLITTATNEEKEEIETLLKNGVFIKESEV